MLNFKNYNYDLINLGDSSQNIISINREKFNQLLKTEEYVLIREYYNPRFNSILPKDLKINEHYYIYNCSEKNVVKMTKQYFELFEANQWQTQTIFNKLQSPELTKYSKQKDNVNFNKMVGLSWNAFAYLILLSGIITVLMYNVVANPWSSEFVGDKSVLYNSTEINNYNQAIAPIKYNDELQTELIQTTEANWRKFQTKTDIKYSLCTTQTKLSYILISNSKSNLKENCEGTGVITPLSYPVISKQVDEFIPDNLITKFGFKPDQAVTFKEGIELITNSLEIKAPSFAIYADTKVIDQKDIDRRLALMAILSMLPVIIGLMGMYRTYRFKKFLVGN